MKLDDLKFSFYDLGSMSNNDLDLQHSCILQKSLSQEQKIQRVCKTSTAATMNLCIFQKQTRLLVPHVNLFNCFLKQQHL